jgi:hypothetical protein
MLTLYSCIRTVCFSSRSIRVPMIGWVEVQVQFENAGRRLEQISDPTLQVLMHVIVRVFSIVTVWSSC